jgi:hypothetical protein
MLWGSDKDSPQGVVIEEFLNNYNLVCLNDGSSTFLSDINSSFKPTAIDLTITSPSIGANAQWEVINTLNSDHLPIITSYHTQYKCNEDIIFTPKWKFSKAD